MRLQELTAAEAVQLLIRIASLREQTELVSFLKTPIGKARVQAVEHLAGGNPRIYVIFAEFLSRESLEELVQPFMALLDALTPYYQSRMQYLSAQQREIVEFLCDRKYPATVKDIAQRCFITSQTTSSQLKELKEKGYVNVESIGRESFYALQEPLMRICLGMKKERDNTIEFMVDFLRAWYSKTELEELRQRISDGFMSVYLELSLQGSNDGEQDPRVVVCVEQIIDCFERDLFDKMLPYIHKLTTIRGSGTDWSLQGSALARFGRWEEAIICCNNALMIESSNHLALLTRNLCLEAVSYLNDSKNKIKELYEQRLSIAEQHIEIDPNNLDALKFKAAILLATNLWTEGTRAIIDVLNRLQSNESFDDIVLVINGLLSQDSSQWKNKITDLINWFEPFPTAVTNGLVSACEKLISPLISDTTATFWHDTWHELTHDLPEYQLPLRLLTAALHYKQKPDDRRVWMELSIEERKILQQALGIDSIESRD